MKLSLSFQLLLFTTVSNLPSARFLCSGVHGLASLSRHAASTSEKSSQRAQTHQDDATQQIHPSGSRPCSIRGSVYSKSASVCLSRVPCLLACVTLLQPICRSERSPDAPFARPLISLARCSLMLSSFDMLCLSESRSISYFSLFVFFVIFFFVISEVPAAEKFLFLSQDSE